MRRLAPVLITVEIFKCRMPTFELFKSSNCLHLKYSKVVSLGMSLSVSLSLSLSLSLCLSFSLSLSQTDYNYFFHEHPVWSLAPKLTTVEAGARIEIFKCIMPTFQLFNSSNCLHLKYSKVVSLGMSLSLSLCLSFSLSLSQTDSNYFFSWASSLMPGTQTGYI